MIVYFKDKDSFTTNLVSVCLDWEIHQSIYDATSSVTILTPSTPPTEGDFVLFDGDPYVGIVTEVELDTKETVVNMVQAVNLFNRDLFYSTMSYTYLEDNLVNLIDTNYTNCTDAIYAKSFLSVSASSHTSGSCKPDLEDNQYTIMSYMSKLRRLKGIVGEWSFNRTSLNLNIYKKTFPSYNIDLSNPRYHVTEQTFSSQNVGKITVYCEENTSYYTYYLLTDGTVTTSYQTTNRVDGEWQTLIVAESADISDSVNDVFTQNYYSHRISFETDDSYDLYDQLVIRTDGKVFDSYVSGVIKRKDSNRKTIECGELQTRYPYLNRL